MMVTSKGTFFHLPKAAGTWLMQVLSEQFHGAVLLSGSESGGHLPVSRATWDPSWPTHYRPFPTFGVVRDPWTWYASLYRFALRGRRQGGITYWGAARSSKWEEQIRFKAFLYGLTHPKEVPAFEPGSLGVIFQPTNAKRAEMQLRHYDQGFYSWLVSHMFGDEATWGQPNPTWDIDYLFDQSCLAEQLPEVLGPIQPTKKEAKNGSGHIQTEFPSSDPLTWYDEEMKDWIATADRWFIDWSGYTFGGPGKNLPYRRM